LFCKIDNDFIDRIISILRKNIKQRKYRARPLILMLDNELEMKDDFSQQLFHSTPFTVVAGITNFSLIIFPFLISQTVSCFVHFALKEMSLLSI